MDRPRFEYQRVLVMLKRGGWQVSKKRLYRLPRLEGVQVRMEVKRCKRIGLQHGRPTPTMGSNQQWSMNFIHDQFSGVLNASERYPHRKVVLNENSVSLLSG